MKPEVDGQPMDVDPTNPPPSQTESTSDAPIEVIDVEEEAKPTVTSQPQAPPQAIAPQSNPHTPYDGGLGIDIYFEASKLPLDVAIFNSARAAGGDEKIRKYLQAVLVIGGSALIPGMAHALESR